MQLIRRQDQWSPFREMEDLTSRMDRLFGLSSWPGFGIPVMTGNGEGEALARTEWAPRCDVSETDKEYRVQVELPNVDKNDVHVRLEEGILTIEGERKSAKEETGIRYHRRELAYGRFLRRFTMPGDADQAKVDAKFKDGILSVSVARSPGKGRSVKEIAIH